MSKEQTKGRARPGSWKQNLLFALVVLALAGAIGGYYWVQRANRPEKMAHLVYGTGERREVEIDLREDGDYAFDSNGYEIHLQVREGTIAFVDSPCPDHVCEGFGWISEVYDWAACIPAQAMLTIEPVE